MLRNYLVTAIRNLLRYKGFALINIFSLTVGIIGCLVIGLFVWDERQYDKMIPEGENVYRLYGKRQDKELTYMTPVSPAYATYLENNYPEVDTTLRIFMSGNKFLIEKDEEANYEDKGMYVESSFFKIFPLKFVNGDPVNALGAPLTVVLTESMANRYFDKKDPVGKTISINKRDFTVTGVLANLPDRFHLDFQYLMSLPSANIRKERMEDWGWTQFYTYVKLKPGANVSSLQKKLQTYVKNEVKDEDKSTTFFQPLYNIHLQSADFIYDNAVRGNEVYVKALTIIALFVLVIACFNFISLATARSLRRAKEIGVRKVVGAERGQLVLQFIGETILLAVFSMILAIAVTYAIVPVLNEFSGKSIGFNVFTNPLLILVLLAGSILIGVLAGIYPALVLSGFQPVKVLKNMKLSTKAGGSWLRPALVVVQFTLSVLLIVCTMIVFRQTNYLNNKDIGFDREQILFFQLRGDGITKVETMKEELKRLPGVVSVTSGYGLPGDQFAGESLKLPGSGSEKDRSCNVFVGDYDYIKTLGMRVIAGRDFSKEMLTDVTEGFIINETAVKDFGFGTPESAIGKRIDWEEWQPKDSMNPVKKGKVIGVIQDFHYKSLHEKITASLVQLYPQVNFKAAVKVKEAGMSNTIAGINKVWSKYGSGYPLDYQFMDEAYGEMYKSEQKLSSLLWIFTIMAIIVGCMGLLGLAAFSAEQRRKELGIRKVLGASLFNILTLLSKNFLLLIIIASLLAFPIAWIVMNNWLKSFPYRIDISWWVFAIAILAALAVALVTVSFQSIKAAIASPVKSLRIE